MGMTPGQRLRRLWEAGGFLGDWEALAAAFLAEMDAPNPCPWCGAVRAIRAGLAREQGQEEPV